MIVAFEGLDYVGKSTQVDLIYNHLTADCLVEVLRSPGGNSSVQVAEDLRTFFMDDSSTTMDRCVSGAASRLAVTRYMKRASETFNKVFILDRWTRSGFAYQVAGEGTDEDLFTALNSEVVQPDLEFILLMSDEAYKQRKNMLKELDQGSICRDSMEKAIEDQHFRSIVKQGMADFRGYSTTSTHAIDVSFKTPEEVFLEIVALVDNFHA